MRKQRTIEGFSESDMDALMEWVSERLRLGRAPRVHDVLQHGRSLGMERLTRNRVAIALRQHPAYADNMPQQREPLRSLKHRPILVGALGHLHADIMFYGAQARGFDAPSSFRAGYLIAKDVLSRFSYAVCIFRDRTAKSMVRAFKDLLNVHAKVHPGHVVRSVSFDKERSVMSKEVQAFFAEQNIKFHAFEMSASKAKNAEACIKDIRTVLTRLQAQERLDTGARSTKWWTQLERAAESLNHREIVVDGKPMGFSPAEINSQNVNAFRKKLEAKVPAYYFAQFNLDPKLVKFAFRVGDLVRAKKIAVSSAVVGKESKRSEVSLDPDLYVIKKQEAFVTRAMTVGRAYKCANIETGHVEVFDEWDLALSSSASDTQ